LDFVAIDFETANFEPDSACSIGIVVVQNGRIVKSKSWLIRPPTLNFYPPFIELHGITPQAVASCPDFSELWPEIKPYFDIKRVVAHNANFDMRVLQATLNRYRLPLPVFDYFCTVVISRWVWPNLPNHKLNTVANYLGLPLKHHDAQADAFACAAIAIRACKEAGVKDLAELAAKIKCRQTFGAAGNTECIGLAF